MEKKHNAKRFASMEMVAFLDFKALTKVHTEKKNCFWDIEANLIDDNTQLLLFILI